MNAGRSAPATSSARRVMASGSGSAAPAGGRVDGRHVARRRAEDVEREVEEHRPAVRRGGQGDRLVDHHPGLVRIGDGRRLLGDRLQDRHVVELLQRPGAPPPLRGAPAEHDERGAVEPRRRHRRHAVGDARAGRQGGDPRPPGELGVGLGGERRRLLVARVDDAHALVAGRLVQRPDVPAVEGEHDVDAEPPHRGDRLLAGVPVDVLAALRHLGLLTPRRGTMLTLRDRNGT